MSRFLLITICTLYCCGLASEAKGSILLACENVAIGAKVEQIDREDLEYFLDHRNGEDLHGVNPANGEPTLVAINSKTLANSAVIIFDKSRFADFEVCEVFLSPLLKPPR